MYSITSNFWDENSHYSKDYLAIDRIYLISCIYIHRRHFSTQTPFTFIYPTLWSKRLQQIWCKDRRLSCLPFVSLRGATRYSPSGIGDHQSGSHCLCQSEPFLIVLCFTMIIFIEPGERLLCPQKWTNTFPTDVLIYFLDWYLIPYRYGNKLMQYTQRGKNLFHLQYYLYNWFKYNLN